MTSATRSAMPRDDRPLQPEERARLQALIDAHRDQPGALLPLLQAVQAAFGCIAPEHVPPIARALNRSRAEVQGVIAHYPMLRLTPPGRHVVQICQAESCLACGGDQLAAAAERVLGCTLHATRADGAVTLEPVYCLGLCANSPSLQIDGRLHARVSPPQLEALLDEMLGKRAAGQVTQQADQRSAAGLSS